MAEAEKKLNIFWFCIPAYGHTNPSVEVVRALTARGHRIRYYSFAPFKEKLEDAGAEFVPCDAFLPPLDERGAARLRRVSSTEMSVLSFETTARMDETLSRDVAELRPDLVVSDSACFWGKLTAQKHGLPLVCSTTTFAFNRDSAKYTKYSAAELADMVFGLQRVNRALKKLRPLGYRVKSALDLVENKNDADTIVYTSARFQPCAESFDAAHYRFVGPSLRAVEPEREAGRRPLVYVSLGTVIEAHPDFYRNCIAALAQEEMELLISCGRSFDPARLGPLPENVRAEPYVDQLAVLAKADLFLTHCGMNSASEGLYLGVPELLFPQTGEQQAVARRVQEMGAGRLLTKAEATDPAQLRAAVLSLLADSAVKAAAEEMRRDFLSCGGARAAVDFIEAVGSR